MDCRKVLYCAVAPLVTVGLLCLGINEYCVRETERIYPTSGVWHLYANDTKDKGLALLNLSVKNGNLLMLGTSELNNDHKLKITNHPSYFYPNQFINREVDTIGKPGAETLINIIRLGSIDAIETVPVVYFSSLTWFRGKEYYKLGIQNNFSDLQYMQFLKNAKITNYLKQEVSKEVYYVLSNSKVHNETRLLAWLNSDNSVAKRLMCALLYPYYQSRYCYLRFKDNLKAYKLARDNKEKHIEHIKKLSYYNDYSKALDVSKQLSVDAKEGFNVYLTKYQKVNIKKERKVFKNKTINISKEYYYHDLFLKTAQKLGTRPLIVLTSINGNYWDYFGFKKSYREYYYKSAEQLNNKYGMPTLNLESIEYEPYAYRDAAHFTTLGWLMINEKITKHFRFNTKF